jgi:hypothetical protein
MAFATSTRFRWGARGQGDADEATAELGGDEHRAHDEHRDQPGECAHQGVSHGAGRAAVAARQVWGNITRPGHDERAARLAVPAALRLVSRVKAAAEMGAAPPAAG